MSSAKTKTLLVKQAFYNQTFIKSRFKNAKYPQLVSVFTQKLLPFLNCKLSLSQNNLHIVSDSLHFSKKDTSSAHKNQQYASYPLLQILSSQPGVTGSMQAHSGCVLRASGRIHTALRTTQHLRVRGWGGGAPTRCLRAHIFQALRGK